MKKILFNKKSLAFCKVIIQKAELEYNNSLHYMQLAKLLHSNMTHDIKEITSKGRNKICVETFIADGANNLVNSKFLKEKGFELFILIHLDHQMTEQETINVTSSSFKILSVRKFNSKVAENSLTI